MGLGASSARRKLRRGLGIAPYAARYRRIENKGIGANRIDANFFSIMETGRLAIVVKAHVP